VYVCIQIRSKLRRQIKIESRDVRYKFILLSSEYIKDGKTILFVDADDVDERTRTDVSLLNQIGNVHWHF